MKIYKITTPHSTKCYVGKTIQKLQARFVGHKSNYRAWLNLRDRHWCSSYGLLWLGDCSIELLEETEDSQAERNWIAKLDCVNSMRMKFGAGDQRDTVAWQKEHYKKPHIKQRNLDQANAFVAANREHYLASQKRFYEMRKVARMECNLCGTNVAVIRLGAHQKSKRCQTIYAAKLHLQ